MDSTEKWRGFSADIPFVGQAANPLAASVDILAEDICGKNLKERFRQHSVPNDTFLLDRRIGLEQYPHLCNKCRAGVCSPLRSFFTDSQSHRGERERDEHETRCELIALGT